MSQQLPRAPSSAAMEPPLHIDTREELVYMLGEACEIEHGMMAEYLYAQFSLKRSVEEGISADQLARVLAWEKTLIDVIKQEMLHLALATNILSAVGAAPHFERPNFPIASRWYPPDVQIALLPFGEVSLRHFMYLERPEGMTLRDAAGFAVAGDVQVPRPPEPDQIMAGPQEWHTVGHLYRGIESGLENLVKRFGHDAVFIGDSQAQATTSIFEWPELLAVTDLRSASTAIRTIVEQGEGARGDWVISHFGRFVGVLEDYLAVRSEDPSFEPARPVTPAFAQTPPDVTDVTLIDDPASRRVADLFNGVYEVIMQVQTRYFVHQGETPDELDVLATTAKHLMNWVMRKLGPVLTTLPVGTAAPGRTVGPAFEIIRPAFFVLPYRDAAWRIIRERLETMAIDCRDLAADPRLAALGELATTLAGFAADFGRRLDARGSLRGRRAEEVRSTS